MDCSIVNTNSGVNPRNSKRKAIFHCPSAAPLACKRISNMSAFPVGLSFVLPFPLLLPCLLPLPFPFASCFCQALLCHGSFPFPFGPRGLCLCFLFLRPCCHWVQLPFVPDCWALSKFVCCVCQSKLKSEAVSIGSC